ncbi:IclR family transcriptional regulator [Actinoalloteichus hoggarensis]|uniref:Glycerol operon regulatory protein n=1 Tax=Actinoalloteichus hoggarensis TaxID=1470176 RepID=A0A221WBU9_9PSEU|nr:IclR family transcriptional regulator [Actinoalloteichus hoggarensis]ASO22757.1 Acetate operon repressor [Actinoalloteichus hoggarensis]
MSRDDPARHAPAPSGGVQSVERGLRLLELLADAGGEMTLSRLAEAAELPTPTIHRLLGTLVRCGYVRRRPDRRYALGSGLIRLGETAGRALGTWARPRLAELTEATGETANLAVLEGSQLVYVAQAPSPHSMRMFTEVGRRVPAHSTAVGKAVLALLPEEQALDLIRSAGMPAQTEHTITTPDALIDELRRIRHAGHAVDAEEQELGVRCLAMAVPTAGTPTAVSVSGPQDRMRRVGEAALLPALRRAAEAVAEELAGRG